MKLLKELLEANSAPKELAEAKQKLAFKLTATDHNRNVKYIYVYEGGDAVMTTRENVLYDIGSIINQNLWTASKVPGGKGGYAAYKSLALDMIKKAYSGGAQAIITVLNKNSYYKWSEVKAI